MRGMHIVLGALLSHWRRHPLQLASVVAGLWLATALWTGVQALNTQARADYARASAVLTGPAQAQLVPARGDRLPQRAYVELRRSGWRVSPVLEGRLRLTGATPINVRLIGIEPLTLPTGTAVAGRTDADIDLGAFIGIPGQAWIAPDTLQRLGLRAGERASTGDGQQLPPLHVHAGLAPGVVIVDIGQAQKLLHAPDAVSRLLLPPEAAARQSALPQAVAGDVQWQAATDTGDLERLTDSFHLNLTALGMLAFIVGLFIVHAAIGLALEQRRGLLRTLRACGVGLSALILALTVELGVLALLSGLGGVATGYVLAGALLGDVAASLRGLYGAEVAGQLSLPPQWWLAGLGMSILGAFIAGGSSLLRAARLPVLALAQPEAWRGAQGIWLTRQVGVAAILALGAFACWQWGNSLLAALCMVAAVLLAGALLLPGLLDIALKQLARYRRGPIGEWFVADARQQLPAVSLALMALLLALAASVGVGSMTEGFRKTFVGWLDERLSADLYITPRDTTQALDIEIWLQDRPGIDAVLPQWRTEVRIDGWPTQLQGVVDDPSYAAHWPLLDRTPDAWQWLARGQGVMVSEQLGRRLRRGVGDTLAIPVDGGTRTLTIVGLYADYGNAKGHALLNATWLRTHVREATLASISLRVTRERVAAVRNGLEKQFELDGRQLVDQSVIKQWSVEVFERTFAATGALNILTLAVAGIALFISLLTLGQSRLAQLAPLWALGVGRAQLAWLTLAQTLMLAGLTVLLAMPLGLLLAWCMVAVVNVQAFGWRLPLNVMPEQLVRLGLLGLATSLIAAAGPLWRLARRQPADLLRQFADER
ncbi:FtsX-like permease family protein [Schauerella aestuarii]|uniref:FtsX-like permease family protein n=1 Tax=Schauerella aestuarii TaxID=2511204 RepID=UPI001369E7BD|nr:FtsX-like permease family protein [Achromobacter aestuarii]MYZ45331.1 FtsX-like permease family protein [Achromobacter aestuarii]